MKLVQATKTRLVFDLGQREKRSLLQMLKLYPCVPSAHHVLSKSGRLPGRGGQPAVAGRGAGRAARGEQDSSCRPCWPTRDGSSTRNTGARLSLSPAEAEWLLQVLNDIRVGSWVILGSPEEKPAGVDRSQRAPLPGHGDGGVFSDAVAGGAGKGT